MDISFLKIPLTQGKFALVSEEDVARVSKHRWFAYRDRSGTWYAKRNYGYSVQALHRFILDIPPGDSRQVDHRNGDGLDNRRSNLRVCSRTENQRNSRPRRNNTLGLKGVTAHGNKWRARIGVEHKRLCLGNFDTPEEAACAYDAAAVKYHGEYARTNNVSLVRANAQR